MSAILLQDDPVIRYSAMPQGLDFLWDHLSLLVVGQSDRVELLDNLLRGVVLLDLEFGVEAHHVAGVDLSSKFEELGETLLLRLD